MSKPVIILAFANDSEAPLEKLKEELRDIRYALFDLDHLDHIKVYPIFNTEIRDLYHAFIHFQNQVVIFHFAGHANKNALFLEDQEADARGIVDLIKSTTPPKLVFLNGCSTLGQVNQFLDIGVEAVIATSRSIKDNEASIFAINFYQALARRISIDEAFQKATSVLDMKRKPSSNSEDHRYSRRFLKLHHGKDGSSGIPWGIYTKNEATKSNWRIKIRESGIQPDTKGELVNISLIVPVFMAIDQYNYPYKLDAKNNKPENELSERELLENIKDNIINAFPNPISVGIRTLFSAKMKTKNIDRLKQIISIYERLSKFLCYILITQLWKEIERIEEESERSKLIFNQEFRDELTQFLQLDSHNHYNFNYSKFTQAIIHVFDDNEKLMHEPFLKEIKETKKAENQEDPFEEKILMNDKYKEAYNYLERLRGEFQEKSEVYEGKDMTDYCDVAEHNLSVLLQNSAFLVMYRLISVRDVAIKKARKQDPIYYDHEMGFVYREESILANSSFKNYHYSDAVLLINAHQEEEKIQDCLNLCPFICDEHVLDENRGNPKFLLFAYKEKNDYLYYEHVDQSRKLSEVVEEREIPDKEAESISHLVSIQPKILSKNDRSDAYGLEAIYGKKKEEKPNPLHKLLNQQFALFIQDFQKLCNP